MSPQNKIIYKAIQAYPGTYEGAQWDYRVFKKGNYWELYKRQLDEDGWTLYCRFVIVDNIIFSNFYGLQNNSPIKYNKVSYTNQHFERKNKKVKGKAKNEQKEEEQG